tara:strand:+ start:263 stop:478 length:216 start_codon:yes stop_codon:yes gene_type:complete
VCVTTTKDNLDFRDSYQVFDDYNDALAWYNHLLNQPETHTASLCKPMESTEPNWVYAQAVNYLKKRSKVNE